MPPEAVHAVPATQDEAPVRPTASGFPVQAARLRTEGTFRSTAPPPDRTLAELNLLRPKAKKDEQADVLEKAIFYLKRRFEMIDYPYFQRRGYPIGSGSVESAHKQVVQRRSRHQTRPRTDDLDQPDCVRLWQRRRRRQRHTRGGAERLL